jgi:heme/copper-type cytochrome/quinol oxidase subunit 2
MKLLCEIMQADMTLYIIWFVVPFLIMLARATYTAYQTKKKKDVLRDVEESSTPFTRDL